MRHSIVIPAYNEAAVLEDFVSAFIGALPPETGALVREIIIVENGSRDDTWGAAQRLGERYPGLVLAYRNSRASYGEAIKRGMLEANGTHLSILECDALDADFTARSIALFQQGAARFIVASKRHADSDDQRPFLRRQLTAWYNRLLKLAMGYPGTDTHGHKSLEAGLAKQLCRLSTTSDESFQTEIVLIAWKMGETITELPLTIAEVRVPGVSLLRRLPKVLRSMGELRRSLARFPVRRSAPRLESDQAADHRT